MKKIILLFLIYLLVASPGISQLPKSDWKIMNLKGKVRMVIDTFYNEILTNPIKVYVKKISFNERGRIIEDIIYSGSRSDTITYVFNEKEELVEILSDNVSKFTYVYDSLGNITQISSFNNGKPYSREVYKYDEKNNPIELNFFLTNWASAKNKEWHYGPYLFKYDEKGNIIQEPRRNSDGWSFSEAKFTLDEKGNRITMDNIDYNYTFKYDVNGNMIERMVYKRNGKPVKDLKDNTYEYEYDKNNNWIQKIDLFYKVKLSSTRRKIIYFD